MRSMFKGRKWLIHLLITLPLSCSFATTSLTQSKSIALNNQTKTLNANTAPALIPPPPILSTHGYVLLEASSGKILAANNKDKKMAPASLTKMMTLYLAFQALQNGQIRLKDKVRISKKAWSMGGSRMFLRAGTFVTVDKLIQGVITASGNDACVALAEYIAGNEKTFARLMNQTATRLTMKSTHYVDSTGLPNPKHVTTPMDMALLAQALIRDFPEYYHYFDQKWLNYNRIKQPNRNRLLWRDPSVDGLKTGHTKSAGFCLVSSAKRKDMRLIAVVMGAPTDRARANNSEALLNYGFRFYKTYPLFEAYKPIAEPRVWMGQSKQVALGLTEPLTVTIPASEYKNLKAVMRVNKYLKAPITKGQQYGMITITLRDKVITQTPLVALQNNPTGGFASRMMDRFMLFIKG
jgi:serine-type D-Ala-D-Ala carboxypeptidase (penicillin-binding protein 5/6)